MKAQIINHQLVLIPDNETEEFALRTWLENSTVEFEDHARAETQFLRGSALKVTKPIAPTYVPPAT